MERHLSAAPRADDFRSASRRTDPFWGGMWSQGALAAWTSASLARRQERGGLGLPAPWRMSEDRAKEIVSSPSRRTELIGALGALDQWRTCTNEQLAAISGRRVLASRFTEREKSSQMIRALFTLGLIDWGVPVAGLYSLHRSPSGLLFYRPSSTKTFDRLIHPLLTWSEELSLTGGIPFSGAHQADRHNILATELALRASQLCEVGGVVGEKLATIDELAYRAYGVNPKVPSSAGPDLVIVRSDGVRIAVEMTATVNTDFARKVDRWARVLEDATWDTSGLMVLFVNVAPPDRSASRTEKDIDAQLRRYLGATVKQHPGSARDRVAEKVALASWTDWFPGDMLYDDEAFPLLRAQRPTGPSGNIWEGVDLLDVFDVTTPGDADNLGAVMANLAGLAGTPDMLVPEDATSVALSGLALDSLSIPRELGTGPRARVPARTAFTRRHTRITARSEDLLCASWDTHNEGE